MRSLFKTISVIVGITAFSNLSYGQCAQEGFRTRAVINSGSGSLYNNQYATEVVIGQHFISSDLNSFNASSATGYWSYMYNPPIIANVDASDGIHNDRISLSWSVNENTPAITNGFKIYRDGYLIGNAASNDYSFIDYNVVPGVYYTYGVAGENSKGIGAPTNDLGYVNPNGVVSGRVTTFSGSSVEGALVSLSPSNNLSVRFNEQGGIYVDTLSTNPNPLVDSVFTLSLWAKTASFMSEGMLFDYGMADGQNFWMGVKNDSSVYISMADLTGTKTVNFKITQLNSWNQWHHLAGVYNGRDLMLFYDGVLVGSTNVSSVNNIYANHKIGIGSTSNSMAANNIYNGYIDEVRLFNRVQRPSEIKKFMLNTLPTGYDGLVAYWKMDEGVGNRTINQVEPERISVVCNSSFSNTEPGVKISGVTNTSGYYLIEGVNYGSGTSFSVIPEKFVSYNTALEFNDIESNYAVTSSFGIRDTATIEMWFSPYHYNGIQYLLSSDAGIAFDLYLDGNLLKLNIDGTTNTIATISGLNYKYLTIKREDGNVSVQIDNGTPQSFTYTNTSILLPSTWQLGRSSAGTNYYSGLIDAVIVWDTILSPTEIAIHNNTGINSITTTLNGLEVVDDRIGAYIHLNDRIGVEIVNEVPVAGALQYGSIIGAQFVDVVAHENGINHQFNPNSRIVTLNNSNTAINQIDFVDITTVPITGIVKYDNSDCYIDFAEIMVDGLSTSPPTYTDANGAWTLEMEPGATAQISASFQSHQMFPTPFFEVRNVQAPKAGIAFLDQESREVSGIVAGGTCAMPIIGTGKTMEIHLNATNGCYSDLITMDVNSSINYLFQNVPPGEYTISVTHSDGIFPGSIGEYFNTLGGQTIDLVNGNQSADFIFRSPHNLELSQLDTNACGIVNLNQGIPTAVEIKVFENYLGQKCYLDTATIIVTDGIGTAIDPNFTGTHSMTTGSFMYQFAGGQANIVAPYTKATQIIVDVNGSQVTQSFEAVVLGKKKRATTFTTTTPEMPLTILRDPPGDGSYAYLETTEEVCMTNIHFAVQGQSVGGNAEIYAGGDITTSIGIGAETELSVNVTATAGISGSVSSDNTLTSEYTNCVSMTQVMETTTVLGDITGEGADIYIGAALNVEYGLTDILSYNDTTCTYSLSTELMIDPKEFSTFYAYSDNFLLTDVIPANYMLGDTVSAQSWESFRTLNQTAKSQALFVENRSFDAGVVYSSSTTTSKSETITKDFSMTLDQSVYGTLGVEVNGIGVSLSVNEDVSMTYGGSSSNGTTKTQSIGYTLADDDLGDNFTVNIYKDRMFGTPVFELVSGESSCPHEQGTLPREGVQILVDNLKESTKINVSTDQAALYDLYLGNTSQSSETMTYSVGIVNASNPNGAVLSINGNILGTSGLDYTVDANIAEFATLALNMGSNPNIFNYDSIQVVFQSLCDAQISDTVMVSAHFVQPCSTVDISSPQNNWVITPADAGVMAIILTGYNETDPNLDLIRVQYREVGSASWINISDVLAANLGPVTTQVDWTIGGLQDGNYEIRALSQCQGGLPAGYSQVLVGIIEQQAPEILGVPQPSDGILNTGDEISVTFNENINCSAIYQADQTGLNNIGLYDLTTNNLINATIQCVGNKITIVPLIPTIYMENQTLEVRITGIEDLVGNVLGPDNTGSLVHKWDFYVNVSPVGWIGSNINEVMYTGSNHSFTRDIENTGGNNVNYSITTPTYISASTPTGTLAAGQQKTITFTVNPQLANGTYIDNIHLNSSFGDDILPMELRVMCEPPTWNVNPALYSFNMNYTVALDIEGVQSQDGYDIIAAFIDGEVRGVANVGYISAIDDYLAFLSVYGNTVDNGKDVTFKVWDASACKLYDQTYEVYPFAPNGQIGTPLSADTIHTMDLLAQTIYLNAGWNWISFNLEVDNDTINQVLSTLSNPSNGLIKSQTQFSQYYSSANAWVGGLDTVNELEMYQVNVLADDSLEYFGRPINVDSTEIPIVAGWNWISYLPQGGMTPDHALQVLTPMDGDLIKNQYFFAQFVAGFGWIGNLSYMDAPSGYLYQSTNADTLIYPIDANSNVIKSNNPLAEQNFRKQEMFDAFTAANISPNQFSSNLNLVGTGIVNEGIITDTGDKIYAYIDGEIRGVAISTQVDAQPEPMFFITVYGDTEDFNKEIEFTYFDESAHKLYSVMETITFTKNGIVGFVNNQQHLTLGTEQATSVADISAMTTNVLSLYPNPVTESTVISIYSTNSQKTILSVYDNIGKLIINKSIHLVEGKNKIQFTDLIPTTEQVAGMYYISLNIDGQVFNVKLINQ